MSSDDIEILKRAIQREKLARKQAEKILEDKSRELYLITQELKETNEKLEDQVGTKESELQGVFDNLLDAYVRMDIFGNVLEMNYAARNLFGYDITKEKLNVVKLIYKEDYKYAMTSFQELVTKGSFSNYQARVYTKDNGIRTVHINASLIFDKNKTPIGAQGIVTDITEELKQKQIFEEQKKQLSVIVENSSLGIALTQFGKIVQTNKAFQKLLGFTDEELLQKEVKDISIKDEYEAVVENLEKMNAGKIDSFSVNKRYVKHNGSSFWAKTNIAAVRDLDGNIKYQVAFIEDITEQLRVEKQRDRLVKKLEKSNQELNDYAHIVSHDLKSPLRSMNALITWLKEDYADTLDDGAQNSLNMLLKKVDKMDHLINGILKYSSIDKQDYPEKNIDLTDILTDIIDVIHIPDHIKVSIINELPVVKGDKFRLQQLFQNLISNAVKYNDKEKGIVEISCKENGKFWEFAIKDNGQGIPDKYHNKIFQIFQTLDNKKESTGVGLSIVKKIVDLYSGKIWVESEEGQGTTFYFTLKK
ncbi:PAS domain S-box-containing protein [Aquimarina sp. MAR_2010_214]|uniref:PAS domain-containing sensor histidine kinase n=1 Tax=Aquimarina sp. MAR_2010_214 TaxID=1250026 RepID=UPI000C701A2A|nr:PAS domain-containing sensor histidine kinase [Aquimarina sp. MAR_2010_214]PKV52985.1 PAS domain S-box-containing protein [Aquimarina sp. MAR_2010_214]